MESLDPAARAFVAKLAKVDGSDAESVIYNLVRAGSRIEGGTFLALALHAGLALPALDLRPFVALEKVSANGVNWKMKFATVELGTHPRLTHLHLGSHGLRTLDLRGCPALVDLDVSFNALEELTVAREAPLEILDADDNRLPAFDARSFPALARLSLSRNALTSLDVSGLAQLRALWVVGNPIRTLTLPPKGAPLATLAVSSCPLGALSGFDVHAYPTLKTLFCDELGLIRLDLGGCASLGHFSCADNSLETLELGACPLLERVDVARNPLRVLDVRGLPRLKKLDVDAGVEVLCTERQKRAIPELRKRFGIKSNRKLADMDLWELDLVASSHNWDDGAKKLLVIARHARCDLGTALKIYWLGEPEELCAYAKPADASKHEQPFVELLRTIEARVAEGGYATREVRFEGSESDETRIPAAMKKPIRGT